MRIMLLFSLILLVSCQGESDYAQKPSILIKTECLDSSEMQAFLQAGCQFGNQSLIKKIEIESNAYDTLHIWAIDYCKINAPFLLYDAFKEYSGDTLISVDLINPPDGRPIAITKNNKKTIYFLSKASRPNTIYKIGFWGDVDSAGTKKTLEFQFFDPN